MSSIMHINSFSAFKDSQVPISTKRQRLHGSYLSSFDLLTENHLRQNDSRPAGQIVSYRKRQVHKELKRNVSKLEPKEHVFNKRDGAGNIKGHLCKIELATLCLLHGLMERANGMIHGFHLAANMDEAADFNDVVFKYKYWCPLGNDQIGTEKSKIIFLHSMHVNNKEKRKITFDVLSSDLGQKNSLVVNLQKHFASYRAIKQQFQEKSDHPIFGDSFEDSDFVIYTNALPDFDAVIDVIKQMGEGYESIFRLRPGSGRCYKINFDYEEQKMEQEADFRRKAHQEIINTLLDSSECRKLAKELAKSVFQHEEGKNPEISHQGILQKYHIPLSKSVIIKISKVAKSGKFSTEFTSGGKALSKIDRDFRKEFFEEAKKITGRSEIELEKELRDKIIKLSGKFGDHVGKEPAAYSLPNDHVHEKEIREFLSKLQIHIGMPDEGELAQIIKEKVKVAFNVDDNDIDNVFSDVKEKVQSWWKEKNYYLTENNRFFHDSIRISISFGVKRPVEMFTGRKKELEKLHSLIRNSVETAIKSQIAVVTGLGGIGKTELIRRYIYKHSKDYDNNVIWIKAESYGTLVDSFCKLAQNVLNIRIKNSDGIERYVGSIVEEVYRYFCKRKCLFIFDNAEKYKSQSDTDPGIDKFLPTWPQNDKIFVVVTSRSQDWGNVKSLQLDAFSKEDAKEFIRFALCLQQGLQEEEIEELSETLHRFPLVLQQVVAYIKEEEDKSLASKGEKFSISGYLAEYKKEGMKMKELDFQLTKNNDYGRTTFITWKISLQKIKAMNYGDEAVDILNTIAYFSPDSISTKIFFGKVTEKRILASALQLLKQYSMITIDSGEAKIHRLVQEIIREDLKMQNKEKRVVTDAMSLLKNVMEGGDEIRHDCTSHAMLVWGYANKYGELVKEFSDMPLDIMLALEKGRIIREEAYQFIRNASDLLVSTVGMDNIDTLLTINAVAVACGHRGRYDEALKFFQDVYNKFMDILSSDDPLVLPLQSNVAIALSNKGKYDEAWEVCQEVLEKRRLNMGDNHSSTLSALYDSAMILNNQRKYDKALEVYQKVLDQIGADDRNALSIKHDMAVVYYHQERYDEAFSIYKEVLEKQSKILGPNDPDTLQTKNNMSLILCAKGQYDEALSYCEDLMKEEEKILGPDNVHSFILKLCRVRILYEKGNYDEALVSCQELLEQKEELLSSDHPNVLQTHDIKAAVLLELGRHEEALLAYNELLDRKRRVFGSDSLLTLQTQNNVATVLAEQGKYNEALLLYKDSMKKYEHHFGFDNHVTLTTEYDIAGVFVDQGLYYEALEMYQKVLSKLQDILEPDHVDILLAKKNMASVLTELGKYEDALETYAEVLSREKKALDPAHPSILLTQINMTTVLLRQGKYDKALLDYQELLDVCKQILSPDHPYNFLILGNMAVVLQSKGYFDMALNIRQTILDKRKEILDSSHPDVLDAEEFVAIMLQQKGKYEKSLKMFSRILDKRQTKLGVNHPKSLQTLSMIAEVLSNQRKYQESSEIYQEVLNRWKLTLGEEHPNALTTQDDIARLLFNCGKYGESLDAYRDVLEKKQRILGLLHPSTLYAQNNIGRVLLKLGKYSDALETFNEVLSKREQALSPGHPDTLDTLDDLAGVFNSQGDYDLSLKCYEDALDKRKRFQGPKHPDTLSTENNIAGVLFKQKLYSKALHVYCKVFDKMEKILSPFHLCILQTRTNIATVMCAQENYEDAFKIYHEVLEKKKQVLGTDHPETLNTLSDIAKALGKQKHFELSMEAYRNVLSKRKRILGNEHPDTLMTISDIAKILFNQGNYETVVRISRKLLDKYRKVFGPESPYILMAQKNIAMSLDLAKNYEEALEAYKDLLEKSEQILGSDHPDTLSVIDNVVDVLLHLGNSDEALMVSQELLVKKQQRLGSHHPSTLFTMESVTKALGDTEEYFAVIKTCVEVLDKETILALYNSDPLTTGYLVLHTLCREGEPQVLNYLLEGGADILAKDEDHTLLHQAVTNNNCAVVKLVLNKIKERCENIVPYIEAADGEGDTPLMWAAQTGKISSVRVLLEWGASVNAKNKSGQTALHWAATGGFSEIVELLLDYGINPNIKDINDASALDLACDELEHGIKDEEKFKSVRSLLLTVTQETVPSNT